jgi:hypothetical protein
VTTKAQSASPAFHITIATLKLPRKDPRGSVPALLSSIMSEATTPKGLKREDVEKGIIGKVVELPYLPLK